MNISPTMKATMLLFPVWSWDWEGDVRVGYWTSSHWLTSQMPRHSGYKTLHALEDRGLLESRWLCDPKCQFTGGWFYRLTHEGVLLRASLEGFTGWK